MHLAIATLAFILCVLSQFTYGLKGMQTWELEDYNDWNLPFAKTVEVQGRYTGKDG